MEPSVDRDFGVVAPGADLWTCQSGPAVAHGRPAVLLSNGGPGCCDYLAPVARMIDVRLPVIRWEQRGCGRSGGAGPYDFPTCLADMEVIRKAYGLDRVIVGGHSWGANLSLAYAFAFPERVEAILFLSGTGIDARWRADYKKNKALRSEQLPPMAYPPNAEVNELVNQSYGECWSAEDRRKMLRRMATPLLVVHGDQDLRPAWATQELATGALNGRFRLLVGAEHVLWLTHDMELSRVLNEFLKPFCTAG